MTNYAKVIPDFGLTSEQLDDKYNPDGDGEHPEITRWDWHQAVAERSTVLGYWGWLRHKLNDVQDELDRDNLYNQEWEDDGGGDYALNEKG